MALEEFDLAPQPPQFRDLGNRQTMRKADLAGSAEAGKGSKDDSAINYCQPSVQDKSLRNREEESRDRSLDALAHRYRRAN